jgi:hypothetical protein
MGQYHYIVNTTKKEYINPHAFSQGLKLLEWSQSMGGTNTALAILLSNSNGRGGGDLHSEHPIIGSWANDNIVVAGDYAGPLDAGEPEGENLYSRCSNGEYKDVSYEAYEAMLDDSYILKDTIELLKEKYWIDPERKEAIQNMVEKAEKRQRERNHKFAAQ